MLKFDKTCKNELKNFIFESNIHDARLMDLQYDNRQKTMSVKVVSSIYNKAMLLLFQNIQIISYIKGDELGDANTILSLTIEDDYSQITDGRRLLKNVQNDCIYFLFQMFSGDELHIISKEVLIKKLQI